MVPERRVAIKVCFISHSADRGGGELSLLELIDALSQRGVECVCILPSHGPLEAYLADRNVNTVVVPYKRWIHGGKPFFNLARRVLLGYLPASFRLAAAIKRTDCDVVYTNTVAVGVGALGARIASKPHIWHIREFGSADHRLCFDLGERTTRKLIGRLSSACIANSRAVADDYRPFLGGTQLHVVYNSVEVPPLGDEPQTDMPWRYDDAIHCCLVGTVAPGKGQEDAVRAMIHLSEMNVPAELLLVGRGEDSKYGQHISQLIEQHGLGDRVHMIGYSNHPLPLMKSADVVLVCAPQEAFGRTTIEAMKLGKPVIGTRSGGTPELVREGDTGFLYEPEDAQALADKIAHLHTNRSLCDSMGSKANLYAREQFNQEIYGREVEEVLRHVVR
jgi:glycosyltransferase involved in cell wall biosynthesis